MAETISDAQSFWELIERRTALSALLATLPDVRVVGERETGHGLASNVESPDVAVVASKPGDVAWITDVRALASAGACVAAADINLQPTEEKVQKLKAEGADAAAFQVDVPLRALFAAPTVAALAATLSALLLEAVASLSDDEAERLLAETLRSP